NNNNINAVNTITSIRSSLAYNQFLLQQEFYGLFMKKFPELKYLDISGIKLIPIRVYNGQFDLESGRFDLLNEKSCLLATSRLARINQ
ncbi:9567_t:CDS:2, partial [Rhizophagus irregularis]